MGKYSLKDNYNPNGDALANRQLEIDKLIRDVAFRDGMLSQLSSEAGAEIKRLRDIISEIKADSIIWYKEACYWRGHFFGTLDAPLCYGREHKRLMRELDEF